MTPLDNISDVLNTPLEEGNPTPPDRLALSPAQEVDLAFP